VVFELRQPESLVRQPVDRPGGLDRELGHAGKIDGGALSISRYFTEMIDPSMSWDDVAEMVSEWGGPFCLKGIMSVEDAK
ncbi:alpha-hydroxy-acid oxidizing protein, partial [Rhizobium johnstonii]